MEQNVHLKKIKMTTILHNKSFLLFIEPVSGFAISPVIDIYTKKIAGALHSAKSGISNQRSVAHGNSNKAYFKETDNGRPGERFCNCGLSTANKDFLVKINNPEAKVQFDNPHKGIHGGFAIVSSLCIHYVAYHREEVPREMLEQILLLDAEEDEPTEKELELEACGS